jgi:hypothetical protein
MGGPPPPGAENGGFAGESALPMSTLCSMEVERTARQCPATDAPCHA